ncbi:NADP-dependent oxidoreductase domain-containing protein [Mycena albidolilacea]|uniref:NADP-dependent oxidoreductase domain-containing protein n=1 Tax=Mycena albidolilacea TaxID=1033008 RepID=A0AAD6YXV7_9AGAR|nr:NADP-dependent oxidoreductase domain-containing protein [Mycena albidolilacea]
MSQTEYPPFDPKGMPFRMLGPSGLRVSLLSLGGNLMLGDSFTGDAAKRLMQMAFENRINTFDTAETYANGKSELELGRVIKELGYKRTDLVVMTKIFWGICDGPNDSGLSRKQYVLCRVIFAHRHDRTGECITTSPSRKFLPISFQFHEGQQARSTLHAVMVESQKRRDRFSVA